MREFIFVNPSHQYDSYTDYRRLVEISGWPVCNQDQIEAGKQITYIVTPLNGDVEAALKARPKNTRTCKVVWWFLERPGQNGGSAFLTMLKDRLNNLVDEIWMSDKAMWSFSKDAGNINFVPVGSEEALGCRENRPKLFDICHMSYVYGRREHIFNRLKCSRGPNGWGDERKDTLLRSRFMMNTHQDEDPYSEPLRFALCAAYSLPMISETCTDPFPYEIGTDFISANKNDLADTVNRIVTEGLEKYKIFGERMFEKATKRFRFIDNLKEMATK